MPKRTSKDQGSGGLEAYVARRVAKMSSVEWKSTPKGQRMEFLKAARRAVAAISKFETLSATRQDRKQLILSERRAKEEGNTEKK
jgi:hypothetical protein